MKSVSNTAKFKKVAIVGLAIAISIGGTSLIAKDAVAADPNKSLLNGKAEVFSAKDKKESKPPMGKQYTNVVAAPGASSYENWQHKTPAKEWFLHLDQQVALNVITPKEKTILQKPLEQTVESVQEWTDTARKLISRYRYLSQLLQKVNVPDNHEDLKEYAKLLADNYRIKAEIYESLITPRKTPETIEDLHEEIDAIQ